MLLFVCSISAAAYIICSSENQETDLGRSVTFECVASGIPNNITFTWKKNGEEIVGETGPKYTIDAASIADVGTYQCIPMNSFGYHNSSTMDLKVKGTVHSSIIIINCARRSVFFLFCLNSFLKLYFQFMLQ